MFKVKKDRMLNMSFLSLYVTSGIVSRTEDHRMFSFCGMFLVVEATNSEKIKGLCHLWTLNGHFCHVAAVAYFIICSILLYLIDRFFHLAACDQSVLYCATKQAPVLMVRNIS